MVRRAGVQARGERPSCFPPEAQAPAARELPSGACSEAWRSAGPWAFEAACLARPSPPRWAFFLLRPGNPETRIERRDCATVGTGASRRAAGWFWRPENLLGPRGQVSGVSINWTAEPRSVFPPLSISIPCVRRWTVSLTRGRSL